MKRVYWSCIAAGLIAILAAGCAGQAPASPAPTQAALASTPQPAAGIVTASAEVKPAQTSNMAFLIAAPVKSVNVKEGDPVKAGQPLLVLDTPELESALAGAQAELTSAQLNSDLQNHTRQYRAWNGHKWIWTHGLPEVQAQADARVLQAQADVDLAQANLAQATLTAPFDGTVVSINVDVGEMVEPNKPVLTIGDLSHLQIATKDLSEREIAAVRIGQTAITRLKAFGQDLPGKVVAISPFAGDYNGDTVFKVTIELDQQPQGLLWGMTGDVSIATQ